MDRAKLEKLAAVSPDIKELLGLLDRAEREAKGLQEHVEMLKCTFAPLAEMSADDVKRLVNLRSDLIKLLEGVGVWTLPPPAA